MDCWSALWIGLCRSILQSIEYRVHNVESVALLVESYIKNLHLTKSYNIIPHHIIRVYLQTSYLLQFFCFSSIIYCMLHHGRAWLANKIHKSSRRQRIVGEYIICICWRLHFKWTGVKPWVRPNPDWFLFLHLHTIQNILTLWFPQLTKFLNIAFSLQCFKAVSHIVHIGCFLYWL